MPFFFSRPLLWFCLLLCLGGGQVLGLDARGERLSGGADPASSLLVSFEDGADEVALPPGGMPLGWLFFSERLPEREAEARLSWQKAGAEGAGSRVWRAVSRGPPMA
jgi:hypothetical protein